MGGVGDEPGWLAIIDATLLSRGFPENLAAGSKNRLGALFGVVCEITMLA